MLRKLLDKLHGAVTFACGGLSFAALRKFAKKHDYYIFICGGLWRLIVRPRCEKLLCGTENYSTMRKAADICDDAIIFDCGGLWRLISARTTKNYLMYMKNYRL